MTQAFNLKQLNSTHSYLRRPGQTWLVLLLLALANLTLSNPTLAAPLAPDTLMTQATDEMIAALQSQRSEILKDNTLLYKLVESILLPHVDIISTSRSVLGKHWKTATKAQKLKFIREFRNLLIRFYGSALAEYMTNHQIKKNIITYLPLRESLEQKSLTVYAQVNPPSGDKVPLLYRMHNTRKGWKVYDVSVSGISLITTYRTSFN
ncbi:MAG: ABC transporter substrate-binding protein, partial [Gammaproteobacteria bacterium]|nr:ABC transporter substrate-binding protein [Gammaproteobacteria bacterium]